MVEVITDVKATINKKRIICPCCFKLLCYICYGSIVPEKDAISLLEKSQTQLVIEIKCRSCGAVATISKEEFIK